ncbi:hypothetical protein Fmac_013104 [Flemingia macrophylla]|uniref:Uncharacterized protein n=1 Tax=Flemingia macrophylla TaxID=520843 RepID=A0ABD1MT42_9FABA
MVGDSVEEVVARTKGQRQSKVISIGYMLKVNEGYKRRFVISYIYANVGELTIES